MKFLAVYPPSAPLTGCRFGLMFMFHQKPARNEMERSPRDHKLKALIVHFLFVKLKD